MKILVTGSESPLGECLVEVLLAEGHEVIGFDRLRPADYPRNALLKEWFEAYVAYMHVINDGKEEVRHRYLKANDQLTEYVKTQNQHTRFLADVRDETAVSEGVSISNGVIHLASFADRTATGLDVRSVIETNLIGALNVFTACFTHVKRCSYLVPDSDFAADDLAFNFNRDHGTEIAVVKAYEESSTEDVIRELIYGLTADHYRYQDYLVVQSAPETANAID